LTLIRRHRKPLLIALALGQLVFLLTLPATRLALTILAKAVGDARYLPYVLLAPVLLGFGVLFNRWMKRLPWAWLEWSLMGQKANLALAPIRLRWFGLIYGLMLAACMPLLAFFEELIFRNGTTDWGRGLLWGGLAFGALHLVSFVSVRMTIYLSLVGVALVGLYMTGGLIAVFVTHAVYNLLALSLMLAEQHLARGPAAVRRLTAAVAAAD
jgi:hypothetical protein